MVNLKPKLSQHIICIGQVVGLVNTQCQSTAYGSMSLVLVVVLVTFHFFLTSGYYHQHYPCAHPQVSMGYCLHSSKAVIHSAVNQAGHRII